MTELTFDQNFVKKNERILDYVRKNNLMKDYREYSLDDLLTKYQHLPEKTALLGLAGQDSPVLFDLEDTKPQSILFANDHLPSLRRLMMVMINSITQYNRPDQIQYLIVSEYPDKWTEYIQKFDPQFDFCSGIVGGYETVAEDWVLYLSQLADARHHGRQLGPTILFFMDDLNQLEQLDVQVRLNYEWLVRNGAKVQVWPLAGINLENQLVMEKYGQQFKTRIIGQTDEKVLLPYKKAFPPALINQLKPNRNFMTRIGSEWIQFWVPKLHS
ncbi:MAG: hypothetical protein CL609_14190 [Anaerolineaceae bacterium]|nr:hypothetical protein [Anaerolineaceae bacterium]